MGYLTVTRREGGMIRLTIDPGVDTEKLFKELLRDGITVHVGELQGQSQARIGVEAPKQILIHRDELIDT